MSAKKNRKLEEKKNNYINSKKYHKLHPNLATLIQQQQQPLRQQTATTTATVTINPGKNFKFEIQALYVVLYAKVATDLRKQQENIS